MNEQRDGSQGGNLPNPTEPQTGESVAKPSEGNDTPKQGESFFTIPDGAKAKLAEHPEVVSLMNDIGKQWQTNYYAKREAESKVNQQIRQESAEAQTKADQLDRLMQNPNFTDAMIAEHNRMRGGGETMPPSPASKEDDFFAGFEDGDALEGLVERIVTRVDNLQEVRMKPFMADLAQNRVSSEISAVAAFVEQERAKGNNTLPDVDVNTIALYMQQHNMGAMDAYKLAASGFLMSGQKPLMEKMSIQSELGGDDTGNTGQSQQTDSSAATSKPGKSGLQRQIPVKQSADAKLADAYKLRESGKPGPNTSDTILEVLQEYGLSTGVPYSKSDL